MIRLRLDVAKGIDMMEALGLAGRQELNGGVVQMPAEVADGYIRKIDLGPMMGLVIHQYTLLRDLTLDIPSAKHKSHWVTFSFRHVFVGSSLLPCVQVSSAGVDLQMSFPAQARINTLIIHIQRDLLRTLINDGVDNKILQTIVTAARPFLYEEICSPEILSVAAQIITSETPVALQQFYLRVKAEELICLFLSNLLKRTEKVSYPANTVDFETIYAMRDLLIADLATPPNLTNLAKQAHMSVSKINRLFKQVFGTTVCSYHQKLRINKAADLIKNKQYSVTEAGYELGFSNLSHFSRIFERHKGMKPKKFSST